MITVQNQPCITYQLQTILCIRQEKKETNLSPFCENVEETEYHLNWDCPKIQQLLAKFVRVCNPKAVKTDFDDKAIIFGDLKAWSQKCLIQGLL